MKDSSIFILVNSVLLSVTSTAFLIISFFLKDLYKDFKKQIERTNEMHADLNVHVKLFQELSQVFQHQMEELKDRISRLEHDYKVMLDKEKRR